VEYRKKVWIWEPPGREPNDVTRTFACGRKGKRAEKGVRVKQKYINGVTNNPRYVGESRRKKGERENSKHSGAGGNDIHLSQKLDGGTDKHKKKKQVRKNPEHQSFHAGRSGKIQNRKKRGTWSTPCQKNHRF